MLRPNASMDQDSTWYRGRPLPTGHCVTWAPSSPRQRHRRRLDGSRCRLVRWGPSPSPLRRGTQLPSPIFRPCLDGWIKMPLGTVVDLGPGDIVLDGHPAPLKRGTAAPPPCFRRMSTAAKRSSISATDHLFEL